MFRTPGPHEGLHSDTCWRDTGQGISNRMFLECVDDNFLLQMTEEPVRRGAVLDLGCDQ